MALVDYRCDGGIGRLTLNRPEAGNAVDQAFIADFGVAIDSACAEPGRALVVAARGTNFSLGGDVRHLAAAGSGMADVLRDMATRFHRAQIKLAALPVPIISAVQGNAVGGGLGLALTGDFLFCSSTARFSTGYSGLALSSDAGVSYFLTRALGAKRATALLIDPRFFSAQEGESLGLVDRVIPDADLESATLEFAARLASGSTAAFAAVKRLTEAARTSALSEHLDRETEEISVLAGNEAAMRAVAVVASQSKSGRVGGR